MHYSRHMNIPKTLSIESMDSTPVSVQHDNFFSDDSPTRIKRRTVFKSRHHTKHKSDSSAESDKHLDHTSHHYSIPENPIEQRISREIQPEMPSIHVHTPEMANPNRNLTGPSYTIQICWCLFDCFHWDIHDGKAVHETIPSNMSDTRMVQMTHSTHPPLVQYKPFVMHKSTSSVSPPTNAREVM